MTITVESLLERVKVTVTEYSEDPWGELDGHVFHVTAYWRPDATYEPIGERTVILCTLGRGTDRNEAIDSFRKSLAHHVGEANEKARLAAVRRNPVSVDEVDLR